MLLDDAEPLEVIDLSEEELEFGPRRPGTHRWLVIVGTVVVCAALIVAGALYRNRSDDSLALQTTYPVGIMLPTFGRDANVYRIVPKVDVATVQRFANALGLHGRVQRDVDQFRVSDHDTTLVVNDKGDVTYTAPPAQDRRISQGIEPVEISPNSSSDAIELLVRMGVIVDRNAWSVASQSDISRYGPNDCFECGGVAVSGNNTVVLTQTVNEVPTTDLAWHVTYHGTTVTSITGSAVDIVPSGRRAVRSVRDTLRMLTPTDLNASINDVEMVLVSATTTHGVRMLVPAYDVLTTNGTHTRVIALR